MVYLSGSKSVQFLSFVYICLAVGDDPVIKRGGIYICFAVGDPVIKRGGVYICLAVGDPVIKREGLRIH